MSKLFNSLLAGGQFFIQEPSRLFRFGILLLIAYALFEIWQAALEKLALAAQEAYPADVWPSWVESAGQALLVILVVSNIKRLSLAILWICNK